MKLVASIHDPDTLDLAVSAGVNFIELRLDLIEGDLADTVELIRARTIIPIIATLRSREEGGRFTGNADAWFEIVGPLIRHVDIVDVEMRYREHAPDIKTHGVQIIASHHRPEMPEIRSRRTRERPAVVRRYPEDRRQPKIASRRARAPCIHC